MVAYTEDNVTPATQYTSDGFSIPAGGGLTYNPGFPPTFSDGGNRIGFCADDGNCNDAGDDRLPSGFHGSVVVSSDVKVVAIGYVANSQNGTVGTADGHAGGNYAAMGADQAAGELFFPIAKHNFAGNTVAYYVQAAGSDASNVEITYTMNDGNTYTEIADIPANRMHMYDPANAGVPSTSCYPADTSRCLGSARVVAGSGQVVGVALEFGHAASPATFLGSTRAFVASDYYTTTLVPVFKHDWFGNWSGLAVQNTTGSTATVDAAFTIVGSTVAGVDPGKVYTENDLEIPPNGQLVFSKFRANLGGMPAGTVGSVKLTSDQPLVAVHNESKVSGAQILSSYNCFSPNNATQTAAAPLVKEFFYGGRLTPHSARGGTSVTVQNAGTVSATVQLKYTAVGGPGAAVGAEYNVTIGTGQGADGTQKLAPGASYVFNMVSDPGRASRYAGVGTSLPPDNVNYTVEVTADQNIIILMQEDHKPPSDITPNDLVNYEGFNLQ
jgi:hypothetical protein